AEFGTRDRIIFLRIVSRKSRRNGVHRRLGEISLKNFRMVAYVSPGPIRLLSETYPVHIPRLSVHEYLLVNASSPCIVVEARRGLDLAAKGLPPCSRFDLGV